MKQFQSLASKVGILLIVCMSAARIAAAQASMDSLPQKPNQVQYIGLEDQLLVFDLTLTDLPLHGCKLLIRDGHGVLLLEERIKSPRFKKRYKVERENISQIRFEIIGKHALLKESFNVSLRIEEKLDVYKVR